MNLYEILGLGIIMEVIQLEIKHAKKSLSIKQDIIFTLDRKHFETVIENSYKFNKEKPVFAVSNAFYGIIYFNIQSFSSIRQLKNTTWHECLHIKYPKNNEAETVALTQKEINFRDDK